MRGAFALLALPLVSAGCAQCGGGSQAAPDAELDAGAAVAVPSSAPELRAIEACSGTNVDLRSVFADPRCRVERGATPQEALATVTEIVTGPPGAVAPRATADITVAFANTGHRRGFVLFEAPTTAVCPGPWDKDASAATTTCGFTFYTTDAKGAPVGYPGSPAPRAPAGGGDVGSASTGSLVRIELEANGRAFAHISWRAVGLVGVRAMPQDADAPPLPDGRYHVLIGAPLVTASGKPPAQAIDVSVSSSR